MEQSKKPTPNKLWSIFTMKCPRCRTGKMFNNKNGYQKLSLNSILDMPEKCKECGQVFDMEPGFWFGTSYVSYALTVAISVAVFVAWAVLIGLSVKPEKVHLIFWCLGTNIAILLILQPWLMRFSRVLYIRFFVSYDPNYKNTKPKEFD
jgi:uncharacterized protein (DUF983 family)